VQRSDIYGDPFDITGATAFDVYFLLSSLQFNDIEDVTFDAFDADIDMSPSYEHASIEGVSLRKRGAWVPLKPRRALELRVGRTARLRVELRGTDAAPTQVQVRVPVKRKSLGSRGRLVVFGGNTGFVDELSLGRSSASRAQGTFDDVIERIESAPHHDEVIAELRFNKRAGGTRERRASTGVAVDGRMRFAVRAVG
jgi:hypothetical protein